MDKFLSQIRSALNAAPMAFGFVLREPRAALLLLRMAMWVATLTLMMKLVSLPRVMRLVTPLRKRALPRNPEEVQARLAHLLDLLLATDIWIFTPTCWKRAPVLYRYLALNGIETRVLFGVRKGIEGSLDGHAWLESNGAPVLETSAPNYKLTFSFPS